MCYLKVLLFEALVTRSWLNFILYVRNLLTYLMILKL